jgi:flagellar biosynthesis protein FlhB
VLAAVTCSVLWDTRSDIFQLARHPVTEAAYLVGVLGLGIISRVGIIFLLLAVGDFFLQKLLYLREMRMTKREVRDEFKETEGNPLHKIARRQFHREILAQSLIAAVKRADVVVVNPTHYAAALEYDRCSMNAPIVVAKGVDFMAAHIRRVARDEGVPIVEDVPLARALHKLDLDCEIPEELYEAVAIVLRWVYELAEQRRQEARHG